MLTFETGDIVKDKKYSWFCQQVNCQGVMGAGLAKQIREQYPEVYARYMELHNVFNIHKLGRTELIRVSDGRIHAMMYAQDGYGRNSCYTDYEAFQKCLDEQRYVLNNTYSREYVVAFPYKIGCGLAGGDWNIILPMLEKFSNHIPQRVVIVTKG